MPETIGTLNKKIEDYVAVVEQRESDNLFYNMVGIEGLLQESSIDAAMEGAIGDFFGMLKHWIIAIKNAVVNFFRKLFGKAEEIEKDIEEKAEEAKKQPKEKSTAQKSGKKKKEESKADEKKELSDRTDLSLKDGETSKTISSGKTADELRAENRAKAEADRKAKEDAESKKSDKAKKMEETKKKWAEEEKAKYQRKRLLDNAARNAEIQSNTAGLNDRAVVSADLVDLLDDLEERYVDYIRSDFNSYERYLSAYRSEIADVIEKGNKEANVDDTDARLKGENLVDEYSNKLKGFLSKVLDDKLYDKEDSDAAYKEFSEKFESIKNEISSGNYKTMLIDYRHQLGWINRFCESMKKTENRIQDMLNKLEQTVTVVERMVSNSEIKSSNGIVIKTLSKMKTYCNNILNEGTRYSALFLAVANSLKTTAKYKFALGEKA